jgi:hypothetical protein
MRDTTTARIATTIAVPYSLIEASARYRRAARRVASFEKGQEPESDDE